MAVPDPIIRRISDRNDPAIVAIARIYTDAIPAAERKPIEWLLGVATPTEPSGSAAGSPGRTYQLLVAESGTNVLGLAVLFLPAEPNNAALLEYLAVAGPARGAGVGGALFRACRATRPGPMLIEIDTADPDADRRRKFYRRLGCRSVLGLQYKLPLPNAGPMGLMIAGVESVRRDDLRRWITLIYAEVYGQRPDDPRIAEILEQVEEIVALDQLKGPP